MIKMEILMLYFYCHNRKMEKNKIQNKNLKKSKAVDIETKE